MANNMIIDRDIKNPELEKLLKQRRETPKDDKAAIARLSESLGEEIVMRATFLAAATFSADLVKDKNGELSMAPGTNVTFLLLDSSKGGKYFPAFTDKAAIEKWGGITDYHTVVVNFDDIARLMLANDLCDGLIINPVVDTLIVERNVVSSWNERKQIIKKGHAENIITNNTPLEIYPANPYPLQLVNVLAEKAKNMPEISRLWLRGITLNGEEGLLLVADYTGDKNAVFPVLGDAGKKFIGGKPLHIVPFEGEFGKNAVERAEPFYTRE